MSRARVDRDRGATDALGLVLLAPAAIGLAVLVIALGRGVDARAQIRSAAAAAAQAAALERSAPEAQAVAERVAAAMLTDADVCPSGPTVVVEYPVGQRGGTVWATVSCEGSNRGIEVVQPTARDGSFRASATVDEFRARSDP